MTYSSTVSFETALRLPEFQNSFGQGLEGKYAYVDGAGGGVNDKDVANWGPAMNGQLITQFDSPLDDNGNRIAIPLCPEVINWKISFRRDIIYLIQSR